ncbi:MAG TPA: mandelate racemase/muconate lactonizing enzyme family protein [Acetobacteraceae bacterium]|jgi:L-alanine-DL-glutamate epimerase-like enolase superfamily enzyme|nr:mandelate racemase/muconate lactonizing enzyme family protein [Acetobacteraceae bacterium]
MRIESVDLFYLAMPEITTEADGSQDALLVRVAGGGEVGWGECEAAPLPSIAAYVCPMSHGVCRPVADAIRGEKLDGPDDISRIAARVAYDSMDLLQAPHTFSGIEMALWDLLGRVRGEPVWRLLGYAASHPKTPYASMLFGDTPQETLRQGERARAAGYAAAKFGWGPVGRGSVQADADHFAAAREGLGSERTLLVDVGQIWGEDVEAAAARLPALEHADVTWLEEPFHAQALAEYGALARRSARVKLAGGEGAHNAAMARHLIDYGGVGYIQIDTGRIGGIGPAHRIAGYAASRGVTFVNHTFTSHLAVSASLQPFAGLADHRLCEFPFQPKPLSLDIMATTIARDVNGAVMAPDAPGLGVAISSDGVRKYLVDTEIKVGGTILYRTPALAD